MDAKHHVIPHGRVLIEGNRIAAVWQGRRRPDEVRLRGVTRIKRGPRSLLYPGLIDLHDHPNFDVLPPVPPPSSHALPAVGKRGADPYDQRYEWNGAGGTAPDEFVRLIQNPQDEIDDVGLAGEEVKYAEVGAMLGGETAIQGAAADPESNRVLVRNVDHGSFDDRIADPQVGPIDGLTGAPSPSFSPRCARATWMPGWCISRRASEMPIGVSGTRSPRGRSSEPSTRRGCSRT
jgi:5-methylthioadenosine/S-adenosylhomocysteine deaminase